MVLFCFCFLLFLFVLVWSLESSSILSKWCLERNERPHCLVLAGVVNVSRFSPFCYPEEINYWTNSSARKCSLCLTWFGSLILIFIGKLVKSWHRHLWWALFKCKAYLKRQCLHWKCTCVCIWHWVSQDALFPASFYGNTVHQRSQGLRNVWWHWISKLYQTTLAF